MRKHIFILLLFCAIQGKGAAQKSQAIYQLFQKYFLALPYDKPVINWLNEIADNNKVTVDTVHKEDTASNILLKGYVSNWSLFEKLDSVKFAVGRTGIYSKFGIGHNEVSLAPGSSFFLQEMFYFPLDSIDGKVWKGIYKPFLDEFKKMLIASYPTGGQGKSVWFTTTHGIPFGGPLVSVDYGKLEKRKLYFINLVLFFGTQSAE